MTPFSLLIQVCGLSIEEVSRLFNLSHGVAKSWADGRSPAPPAIIAELRWLHGRIVEGADNQLKALAGPLGEYSDVGRAPIVEIGFPDNDKEAQEMGMPCVGVWRAMAGLLVARLNRPVTLVPQRVVLARGRAR